MGASNLTPSNRQTAHEFAQRFGALMRDERVRRGYKQENIARNLGTSQREVSRVERGVCLNMKLGTMIRSLERFGWTLDIVPCEHQR